MMNDITKPPILRTQLQSCRLRDTLGADLGRLFRPTLSFFLGSVCNITVAAFVHSDAFSSACHRQKGAAPRGSLNRAFFNFIIRRFHYENLLLEAQ